MAFSTFRAVPISGNDVTYGNGQETSPTSSPQPVSQDTPAAVTFDNPPVALAKNREDRDFDRAIELSLQDQAQARKRSDALLGSGHRRLRSWCEPSVGLVLSLNNEFTPLNDNSGDTAIYFGYPPQMPEQSDKDYDYIKHHFDRVHIVQSTNLRLMGDGSRFTERDLLNPTKSFRAERRLRKLGVLNTAEAAHGGKFKYYIDLRPPKEDDEAVVLITDLTCTRGVLTWHLALDKYDLSPLAVLGHDEFGVQPYVNALVNPVASSQNTETTGPTPPSASNTTKTRSKSQSSGDKPASTVSAPQIAPEYSLLRHWSAIERVLQAIQGNDPKLDSAPKVWTFFAVARYLGCASHERISGWIMTWLYTGSNSNFIQNNPEVAYRIAMGIESPDLIKDAFSILVGERALIEACGEFNPEILTLRSQSVHGRKLELLDDDERNRIDHAASSFVSRIRGMFYGLCQDMDFLHESATYTMLDNAVGQTPRAVEALKSAKSTVKDYIRSRIYYVLCQDQGDLSNLESDPKSTLPFRSASVEDYGTIYRSLHPPMRHFTKTFWFALEHTQFVEGMHNTSSSGTIGWKNDTEHLKALKGLYKIDPLNGIVRVPRSTLNRKIMVVNQMFCSQEIIRGTRSPKRRKTIEFDDPSHNPWNIENPIFLPNEQAPVNPSWMTASTPPGPTISAPATEHPVFALRPKSISTGSSLQQTNNNIAYNACRILEGMSQHPRQTPLNHEGTSGVTGSQYEQVAVSENHSAPAALVTAATTSSSSSNMFFDSTAGEYEGLNITGDTGQMHHNQPAMSTPRTGNRVKQSFSNSNTDNEATMPLPRNYSYPIDPGALLNEVSRAIETICSRNLHPPHLFHQTGLLPTDLFDNLLCLNANEFRYLPLWDPDGNDDGTGGVFEEVPVPNLDPLQTSIQSFGPGRIKRGFDQADTEAGSEIEEITSSQAISTVGKASKLATDGTRTVKSVSSVGTITVSREMALTDLDDLEVVDRNVSGIGKVAVGTDIASDTDMLSFDELDNDEDDAHDDNDDAFDDGDSFVGDDNWEGERAEGLIPRPDISASTNKDTARDGGQSRRRAETVGNDECQTDDGSSDFETIPRARAISIDEDEDEDKDVDGLKDSGKGKAKVQNFPHGFVLPDLPTYNQATDTERERVSPLLHHPYHERPRLNPHSHAFHHVRRPGPYPLSHPHHDHNHNHNHNNASGSSSNSVVLIERDDNHHHMEEEEEDDDDFELI
ncbi:hypothetical protein FOPE_02450 [Fonsecaea pedrosoi]|nr:hypothetical protein FOPE_02450 [Fonsecaea pedrosoi]